MSFGGKEMRHHRRQLLPDERRRLGRAADERGEGARSSASTPLARIVGMAVGGVKPQVMGLGPIAVDEEGAASTPASRAEQIDRVEFNEAFAAQVIPSLPRARHPAGPRERERRLDRASATRSARPARGWSRPSRTSCAAAASATASRRSASAPAWASRRSSSASTSRPVRAKPARPAIRSDGVGARPQLAVRAVAPGGPRGRGVPPGAAVRPRERLSPHLLYGRGPTSGFRNVSGEAFASGLAIRSRGPVVAGTGILPRSESMDGPSGRASGHDVLESASRVAEN